MQYENLINYENINKYVRDVLPKQNGPLDELEKECRELELPIIKPEMAEFLKTILSVQMPQRILEIGTCVGFSALLMLSIVPTAKITTIDRYKYMIEKAYINFDKFSATKQIKLLEGQATDILPALNDEYDFIFLDAAKAQYPFFYKECRRLLKKGGIFIADNVLASGIVADEARASRRDMTTVKRLREFIDMALNDSEFTASLLPFADGVIFSKKN